MSKLISAPNLLKQPSEATECKIFIGSQAWDFAKLPMAERTQAEIELNQALPTGENIPPIVLSEREINNLTAYRIAPPSVQYVELHRANKAEALKGNTLTIICDFLAKRTKATTVYQYDEAENLIEDLSNYVQRLRTDESTQEIAELITESSKASISDDDKNKRQPYIEKRTTNGIKGLYRVMPKFDNTTGKLLSEREEWLSDVVDVIGIGRSDSEDFIVLEWKPEGSKDKIKEALPLEYLGEREGWKLLKKRGLKITTKSNLRNELADYIQNTGDRKLWTITNATGWQNGAYILPNGEIIGTPETPVLFRSQSASFAGYDTKGTLESWQEEIAQYVNKNPSMMLGVAVALSAPLIEILGAESFGVHLFGGSTAGKTTTANIASSIYGHPEKTRLSWNATSLGLTNEASARNDCFMPLDEIGQGSARKHVEQTAYALFNGVGKIQGAREGGNRELQRWRIMAFSTGEIDLEGYLSAGGVKTNAGQLVRLLNVPIKQALVYHKFNDGKAHADHLNQASKAHYGVVGREWIKWLIEHRQDVIEQYNAIKIRWLDRLPTDASGQVQRVAGRFAILETALQLSSHLTLWESQDNSEALIQSFNEWVNIFGLHSREEKQVIEQVNGWLLANAEGRFIRFPIDEKQKQTIANIAGYRMMLSDSNDTEHFYLYPIAFDEAINGHPKNQACQILADNGILKKGNETRYKYQLKIPHKVDPKRTRCYVLYPIIEQDEDEPEG
ncbi:putative DNA primase/helicase [Otariodibacter oris]|uniref:Putative DNA primase/helicase n=2 Tax=Otariodibacter oris TaxID=1032623 RepID=A0A420XFE3_9PAST|nr:putative DNA primase/helicase [Otariodibacter oris]